MSKIKVSDILEKHGVDHFSPEHAKKKGTMDWLLVQAIKETVDTVLDRVADKATVDFQKRTRTTGTIAKRHVVNGGDVFTVWKQSILALKEEVDYE